MLPIPAKAKKGACKGTVLPVPRLLNRRLVPVSYDFKTQNADRTEIGVAVIFVFGSTQYSASKSVDLLGASPPSGVFLFGALSAPCLVCSKIFFRRLAVATLRNQLLSRVGTCDYTL